MVFINYSTGSVDCKYLPDLKHKSISKTELVSYIQIDGHEMQHIKEIFGTYNGPGLGWNMSIPWNFKVDYQTYYGDIAKTILANL